MPKVKQSSELQSFVKGTTTEPFTGFDGDFTLESAKKGDIL